MSIRRLLPDRTDISLPKEATVWDLDSEEADDVFTALSSKTARKTLTALYDEPQTASELAKNLELSLQNVDYHLQNLIEAGLIEVAGIKYSDSGNEMKIYAPATNAVVVLSTKSTAVRLRSLITSVFSALLLIGLAAILFRTMVGGLIDSTGDPALDGPDQGERTPHSGESDTEFVFLDHLRDVVISADPASWVVDPGVTFFLGAVVAILILVKLHWW